MIKRAIVISFIAYLGWAPFAQAQTRLNIKENETIELTLSRNDFNRLFVEDDKITILRFPDDYLGVENDKDGSVYVNVKYDKPFTLFVTTEKGIHFSAIITLNDELGKTIGFATNSPIAKIKEELKPKSTQKAVEKELVALVSSVEKEEPKTGFKAQRPSVNSIQLKPNLTSTLVYTLSNAQQMGQKFQVKNTGRRPVSFEDKWFKDKDTKALLVKERVVYPNETITVVRIEEGVTHG